MRKNEKKSERTIGDRTQYSNNQSPSQMIIKSDIKPSRNVSLMVIFICFLNFMGNVAYSISYIFQLSHAKDLIKLIYFFSVIILFIFQGIFIFVYFTFNNLFRKVFMEYFNLIFHLLQVFINMFQKKR